MANNEDSAKSAVDNSLLYFVSGEPDWEGGFGQIKGHPSLTDLRTPSTYLHSP